MTFITLEQAKDQLNIDAGLTVYDNRINDLIGATTDWVENFTNRNLAELLELPVDSPAITLAAPDPAEPRDWGGGYNWFSASELWLEDQWRFWWTCQQQDDSRVARKRRDVRAAALLYLETLFDRNIDNFKLLERRATDMLWPYRVGLGV